MKKQATDEVKLKILLLAGSLLRLYYILATPVIQSRQYDLGTASPEEGIFTGHLGYIFYLFTHQLIADLSLSSPAAPYGQRALDGAGQLLY